MQKEFFRWIFLQHSYIGGATSSEQVIIQNMYFFEAGTLSEQLFFQKKNFFRSKCFLKAVTFIEKLVLPNQFCSIYTWKDFPLISIYSFSYTIVWFDFEIPQLFIIENNKQRLNFNVGCVTNVTY